LGGIRGIGGNRLNSQQSKQAVETGIQFAIDMAQDRRHSIISIHVPTVMIDECLGARA
jgi:hypothetical protein